MLLRWPNSFFGCPDEIFSVDRELLTVMMTVIVRKAFSRSRRSTNRIKLTASDTWITIVKLM